MDTASDSPGEQSVWERRSLDSEAVGGGESVHGSSSVGDAGFSRLERQASRNGVSMSGL
jgi:hypothetical protein